MRDPKAVRARARAADGEGRIEDAIATLRAVVETTPAAAAAHAELAQLLQRAGRSKEALILLEERMRQFPDAVWPLSITAAVLDTERRTEESLPVHEALVGRISRIAIAWVNYGQALRAVGRVGEAVQAFRKAAELEPTNGTAWWMLSSVRRAPLDQSDVEQLEWGLVSCSDDVNRVPLHFALGRALEDVGDFERSFRQYEAGNELRTRLVRPASASVEQLVSKAETLFSPQFFAEFRARESGAQGPIFIVGMPRSGSTLVEQILAGHPCVEALGELPDLQEIVREVGGMERVASLQRAELRDLGERYLAGSRRYRRTDRSFFTDKLPANWQLIGLIRLILPGAKVIDVRREPMACCFANYAFYFNRQTNLAAGLADLARYYRAYACQVDHFSTVLPETVRTVSYEHLIEDVEDVTRALLEFLGLPFHPECLRPAENGRAVHTPSAEQVRQPIHRDANRRWRNYAAWLAPLTTAFAVPAAGEPNNGPS
jgi:tetratricopeptide (TPR) repeat protein